MSFLILGPISFAGVQSCDDLKSAYKKLSPEVFMLKYAVETEELCKNDWEFRKQFRGVFHYKDLEKIDRQMMEHCEYKSRTSPNPRGNCLIQISKAMKAVRVLNGGSFMESEQQLAEAKRQRKVEAEQHFATAKADSEASKTSMYCCMIGSQIVYGDSSLSDICFAKTCNHGNLIKAGGSEPRGSNSDGAD